MATSKKRITVSLSDDTYDLFERFAKMQGHPKSRLVADLLEHVAPMMRGTVEMMEAAMNAPDSLKLELAEVFQKLEADILAGITKEHQKDLFPKKH